jgi:hypothetical protein
MMTEVVLYGREGAARTERLTSCFFLKVCGRWRIFLASACLPACFSWPSARRCKVLIYHITKQQQQQQQQKPGARSRSRTSKGIFTVHRNKGGKRRGKAKRSHLFFLMGSRMRVGRSPSGVLKSEESLPPALTSTEPWIDGCCLVPTALPCYYAILLSPHNTRHQRKDNTCVQQFITSTAQHGTFCQNMIRMSQAKAKKKKTRYMQYENPLLAKTGPFDLPHLNKYRKKKRKTLTKKKKKSSVAFLLLTTRVQPETAGQPEEKQNYHFWRLASKKETKKKKSVQREKTGKQAGCQN